MATLATYNDWKRSAQAEDRSSGAERWKAVEQSDLYDHKIIRRRYDELVEVRTSGDSKRLDYYLNEGLHGNMGGMGAPALYRKSKFGTKSLIVDYTNEIVAALEQFAAVDEREISFVDKLDYFRRASHCFGRSALMLSGAGSLGPFHIGVVKALAEQHLLPSVLSGASAGSVVAAMACTHHSDQLAEVLADDSVANTFETAVGAPSRTGWRRPRVQLDDLKGMLEARIPDMTFAEAFEETGRFLNVSVAPAELHQRSRLLNNSTSPNVLIREALQASCAIPGIFPAVTLVAKNAAGERQPYVPSRQWVDGSIAGDLPARRLSRLYGVNHFITSQTNPVVLWALQDPHSSKNLFGQFASIYQSATREWLRAIYPWTMEMVRNFYPLNTMTRLWFSILTQEYTADINIIPRRRFVDPSMLLAVLTPEETLDLVREGEAATWPRIEMIRICTQISRTIDELRTELERRYLPA